MELKNSIKELAREKGYSMINLADILGFSRQTFYKISYREAGSLSALLRVAYLLDCDVTDILDLTDEQKKEIDDRAKKFNEA